MRAGAVPGEPEVTQPHLEGGGQVSVGVLGGFIIFFLKYDHILLWLFSEGNQTPKTQFVCLFSSLHINQPDGQTSLFTVEESTSIT